MASVEEILDSMLNDMVKYQKEYENATVQVNSIVKEYSSKIDELQKQRIALQEEGNKKIEVLDARRSQLSGMYSSLYEQYKRFAGKEPDFTNIGTEKQKTGLDSKIEKAKEEKLKEEKAKEEKAKEEKVKIKKEKMTSLEQSILDSTKEVEDKNSKLSQDEIAKLSQITHDTTDNVVKDSNGNEIPEYLVDSYKK